MERNRVILIALSAALVGFLLGFLPQWSRANGLSDRVRDTDRQMLDTLLSLRLARVEGQIGYALSESLSGNQERARQAMTGVFEELQAVAPRVPAARRAEIDGILAERDEIITLLARANNQSTPRLNAIYARYHAAIATPAPVAGAAAAPAAPR
ncbi:MAG TPA: hypothetical protein VNP72_01095 [Longimicrobium sp.]|nr:hypothetical protein [Longimicrobium sp.]